MGMVSFFSSIADNFINHYKQLTESVSPEITPKTNATQQETLPVTEPVKTDSYQPSKEAQELADNNQTTTDDPTDENTPAPADNSDETPPATIDDKPATEYTRINRRSQLNYQMKLEFNLAAITQTIEKISDGDTQALEEFAAAGFGLRASMDFKGHQLINAKGEFDDTNPVHERRMALNKSKQARQFSYQDRNFGVQSFYNESTRIQSNMNYESRGSHRLAVNKFALRFRMDSSLSFSMLNRFNVQTQQMAETDPTNLNDYMTTAGNAVETSTEEMMGVFFDAVDAYLNSAEEQLSAKASEYFDMATKELGFSGEIVDAAKDQFVGTIDSFFGRVNEAVDSLRSQFAPQSNEPIPDDIPDTPTADYYIPAVAEDKAELAIA